MVDRSSTAAMVHRLQRDMASHRTVVATEQAAMLQAAMARQDQATADSTHRRQDTVSSPFGVCFWKQNLSFPSPPPPPPPPSKTYVFVHLVQLEWFRQPNGIDALMKENFLRQWGLFIKMATDWEVSEVGDTCRPAAGPGRGRSVQIEWISAGTAHLGFPALWSVPHLLSREIKMNRRHFSGYGQPWSCFSQMWPTVLCATRYLPSW